MKKLLFSLSLLALLGSRLPAQVAIPAARITGAFTGGQVSSLFPDGSLGIAKTAGLQAALDLKAPLDSPTFTGTAVLPSTTSIGTTTNTELGYVHNVTSPIQTQLTAETSRATAAEGLLLTKSLNLSDLGNAATARTNLGLGTLATQSGTFSGTSSGTNTGDETTATIKTKLSITTLSGSNTGDQTISITGDGTASGSTGTLSLTVTKLNGASLAGLSTGLLKNTTSTGVPVIATSGTDYLTPLDRPRKSLEPVAIFSANLSSTTPDVGSATVVSTRPNDGTYLLQSGLWAVNSHNVLSFSYDSIAKRVRYKAVGTLVASADTNALAQRDLTQSDWAKTNVTAAKDQVGITGASNVASSITSTSANGTVLLAQTVSSAKRTFSAYLRRITGSGRVWMTRDGGTHWLDVTSQVQTETFTRVAITSTLANPSVGFMLETSGDAIAIDAANDTNSAFAIDPLFTHYQANAGTLQFTALAPAPANARLIELSCRIRVGIASGGAEVLSSGGVAENSAYFSYAPATKNFNLATFSGSSLQYNVTSSPSNGPFPTRLIDIGDDAKLTIIYGGGTIQFLIDDVLQYIGISDAANTRLDPVNISVTDIVGDGLVSDLEVKELRPHNIILVGDSITAQTSYNFNYFRLPPRQFYVTGLGNGGDVITDVTARVAGITKALQPNATDNTIYLEIGTNTLAGGTSAATALTQYATLITAIKSGASGRSIPIKIIALTVLDRSGGFSGGVTHASFNAAQATFNAGIIAAGADQVIDWTTVSAMSDSTDTRYFDGIGVHPNPAAHSQAWSQLIERTLR